jgi:hypothetical protein
MAIPAETNTPMIIQTSDSLEPFGLVLPEILHQATMSRPVRIHAKTTMKYDDIRASRNCVYGDDSFNTLMLATIGIIASLLSGRTGSLAAAAAAAAAAAGLGRDDDDDDDDEDVDRDAFGADDVVDAILD